MIDETAVGENRKGEKVSICKEDLEQVHEVRAEEGLTSRYGQMSSFRGWGLLAAPGNQKFLELLQDKEKPGMIRLITCKGILVAMRTAEIASFRYVPLEKYAVRKIGGCCHDFLISASAATAAASTPTAATVAISGGKIGGRHDIHVSGKRRSNEDTKTEKGHQESQIGTNDFRIRGDRVFFILHFGLKLLQVIFAAPAEAGCF